MPVAPPPGEEAVGSRARLVPSWWKLRVSHAAGGRAPGQVAGAGLLHPRLRPAVPLAPRIRHGGNDLRPARGPPSRPRPRAGRPHSGLRLLCWRAPRGPLLRGGRGRGRAAGGPGLPLPGDHDGGLVLSLHVRVLPHRREERGGERPGARGAAAAGGACLRAAAADVHGQLHWRQRLPALAARRPLCRGAGVHWRALRALAGRLRGPRLLAPRLLEGPLPPVAARPGLWPGATRVCVRMEGRGLRGSHAPIHAVNGPGAQNPRARPSRGAQPGGRSGQVVSKAATLPSLQPTATSRWPLALVVQLMELTSPRNVHWPMGLGFSKSPWNIRVSY
mmetsp:Transcript_124247/g.301657  ORF Transcript_124247/g.301657 Transcript_124247/m.301657 type:complete len:333 (+) Transcript_124247:338-1336(+)